MEIHHYLNQRKDLENILLDFIDSENDTDNKYQQLIGYLKEHDIENNYFEFQNFLFLIFNISDNHQRRSDFFQKIEKILFQFKEIIKQTFSHIDFSNILQINKRIIVFLCKESIITIYDVLNKLNKKEKIEFENYFYIEINKNENQNEKQNQENEIFKEKRNIGENDNYLAQLIRIDSIDEFIPYITRCNISLSSTIKESIFESNSFLLKKEPTLIEYAAFYGSIQIFQYLRLNNIDLTSSLWLFVIHGRNPELIHLLEENNVKPDDESFKECFIFSIKCHHNELSNYIKDSLMPLNENAENDYILSSCLQNFNYNSIPETFNINTFLYYACKFNHFNIVDILLSDQNIDVNVLIEVQFIKILIIQFSIKKIIYNTPLNIAIEQNNIDIIKLLLINRKIDINKIAVFIN